MAKIEIYLVDDDRGKKFPQSFPWLSEATPNDALLSVNELNQGRKEGDERFVLYVDGDMVAPL